MTVQNFDRFLDIKHVPKNQTFSSLNNIHQLVLWEQFCKLHFIQLTCTKIVTSFELIHRQFSKIIQEVTNHHKVHKQWRMLDTKTKSYHSYKRSDAIIIIIIIINLIFVQIENKNIKIFQSQNGGWQSTTHGLCICMYLEILPQSREVDCRTDVQRRRAKKKQDRKD